MNKKAIFSIIISIALVWYLLAQIEVGAIIKTLKDVPPGLVLLGFAFYALSYLFRALRFKALLQKDISLGLLFNIVSVHTMWTNILPFRTGELSYLYLLKKRGGAGSYMTGVPSLILSRVFDLVAISILFLFSYIRVETIPKELEVMGYVVISFILFLLAVFMFLIWKRERFLGRAKYYIIRLKLDRVKFVERLLGKGRDVLEGFKTVKSIKAVYLTAIYSLLVWSSIYVSNFILWKAVGVNLQIWRTLFINTFFVLAGLFPFHGWAGFGTMEGVWTLTIIRFGIPKEVAIVTGFQLHIISLCFATVLGMAGYLLMNRYFDRSGGK